MTNREPWTQTCEGCGHPTDDWVMMTPWYVCRPGKPVPICWQCAQREDDFRREKGE